MAKNDIEVKITAESELQKQMRADAAAVKSSTSKMKSSFGGLTDSVKGLVGAYVGLQGIKIAASFMADAAKTAGNLQEALSKQSTVFRGLEKEVKGYNKVLTESFALSRREAAQFTSTIQDTLVPLGLARAEAGEMSFEVVKLARDLASFNNLPTEQVVRDIQSALVGNVETLRKYGVAVNQSMIEQKAMESGLIRTKNELTPTTKALAIMKLTIEGSTDAMGDFERTSDSFNNQLVTVNSAWEDFKATLGSFLTQSDYVIKNIEFLTLALKKLSEVTTPKTALDKELETANKEAERLLGLATRNKALFETEGMYQESIKKSTMLYRNQIEVVREIKKEIEAAARASQASDIISGKQKTSTPKTKTRSGGGEKAKGVFTAVPSILMPDPEDYKEDLTSIQVAMRDAQQQMWEEEFDLRKAHEEMRDQNTKNHIERRKKLFQEEAEARKRAEDMAVMNSASAFRILAGINKDASKENFAMYKAASFGEATVAGILAIQKAWGAVPFPANLPGVAVVGAATAANLSRISSMQPPKFQQGGIVGGNSFSGDQVTARVNSGEMILNRQQQTQLFSAIGNGKAGGGISIGGDNITINGDADEDFVQGVVQTREQKLDKVRNMLIELKASGQLQGVMA